MNPEYFIKGGFTATTPYGSIREITEEESKVVNTFLKPIRTLKELEESLLKNPSELLLIENIKLLGKEQTLSLIKRLGVSSMCRILLSNIS
jgi:hypothetical protein